MQTTRYLPPPLDYRELLALLKDTFSEHAKNPRINDQLQNLVYAYGNWWILMLTFPERRIVATPPLWFIKKLHAIDIERFFYDCFNYLGRIPQRTDLWGGELDFRGTHDTARSIQDRFEDAGYVWEPLLRVAKIQKAQSIIRLN